MDPLHNELLDRIVEGKEGILEETSGILKDVFQENDSRQDSAAENDHNLLAPLNDAVKHLAMFITTLQ